MKFFTAALVLALAAVANASLYGWGAGSKAVHVSNAWAAAPYASAWGPAATHWGPAAAHWAPASAHWAAPIAAHWTAPAAVTAYASPVAAHWAAPAAHWDHGHWNGDAHWAGPHTAVVAAHAAPVEHSASYVAANRGSKHIAPLPGHVHSVKSINVQPAPGTHW